MGWASLPLRATVTLHTPSCSLLPWTPCRVLPMLLVAVLGSEEAPAVLLALLLVLQAKERLLSSRLVKRVPAMSQA